MTNAKDKTGGPVAATTATSQLAADGTALVSQDRAADPTRPDQ